MRPAAEININIPRVDKRTRIGNSNLSIFSAARKSRLMTKVTSDPASVSTFMKRPNPSLTKAPSKTIAFVLPPSRITTIAAPRRPAAISVISPSDSLPRIAPSSTSTRTPAARRSSGKQCARATESDAILFSLYAKERGRLGLIEGCLIAFDEGAYGGRPGLQNPARGKAEDDL